MRDYQIISPSLEGVLSHSSVMYEGINCPVEILRVLDGPASRGVPRKNTEHEQKVLQQYFQDLYEVFQKKLSYFVVETESSHSDTLKLQAMLQEMIKVKRLMANGEVVR